MDDAIVVCEAGATEVDVVSYRASGKDTFISEECFYSQAAPYGSLFLDIAFEKYVKRTIGESQYERIKSNSRDKMMQEFEHQVKRQYTGDALQSFPVELPGVKDDLENGIVDGHIILKPFVLQEIFGRLGDQICDLVQDQVFRVEARDIRVKTIALVGGFGTSHYLYRRLVGAFSSRGINIIQPDRGWSAACRGATLRGLESARISRRARCSYGIRISVPFDRTKHQERNRHWDEDVSMWKAMQILWFIQKGDPLGNNVEIEKDIQISKEDENHDNSEYPSFSELILYSLDDEPPSEPGSSVIPLCAVTFRVPVRDQRHRTSGPPPSTRGFDPKHFTKTEGGTSAGISREGTRERIILRMIPSGASFGFEVLYCRSPLEGVSVDFFHEAVDVTWE